MFTANIITSHVNLTNLTIYCRKRAFLSSLKLRDALTARQQDAIIDIIQVVNN